MSLIKYIIRRMLALVPVLFGVLTLTFILSRAMPGDPVLAYLPERYNPAMYAQMRSILGLDKPILVQYVLYLQQLFTGNWGYSISIAQGKPVWSLIMVSLPRTVDLSIFSIVIAGFVGIKTGVISATHRNKFRDTFFRGMYRFFFWECYYNIPSVISFQFFQPQGSKPIVMEIPHLSRVLEL